MPITVPEPDPVPVTEARARIADLVGRAQHGGARTVLTKHGTPVAAVVPIADVDRLVALEADAAALADPAAVHETVTLPVAPLDAWRSLTSPPLQRCWWPGVVVGEPVGAPVDLDLPGGGVTAEVVEVVAGRSLVLRWSHPGHRVTTEARLRLAGAETTVVELTCTGVVDPGTGGWWRARLDAWADAVRG